MITLGGTLSVSGTFTLTDDLYWSRSDGAAIIANGPATIDLNGHRTIGIGGAGNTSIGILATDQSNITVKNGTISGFNVGVNVIDSVARVSASYSQSNNSIIGLTIKDCISNGFMLGGSGCRVEDTVISGIGLDGADDRRAYGGQFFGPNAVFNNSRVSDIVGGSESVAVSFTGRLQAGSIVSNSMVDGRLASGQSFGIWNSSTDTIRVVNSNLHDWDFAVGGAGAVIYSKSTFANNVNDFGYSARGATDADGQSTFIPLVRYGPDVDVIIGDTTGGRYYGSNDDDFIAGLQGHDHLIGGAGSDTFAFLTAPSGLDKDVILGIHTPTNLPNGGVHDRIAFERSIYGDAADANGNVRIQIGRQAVGNQATFFEDPLTYTLYYNSDGAGSAAAVGLAYITYYILQQSDLIWLDPPKSGELVAHLGSVWSIETFGDFNGDGNTDLIWRNSAGALGEWFLRDGERIATMALPGLKGWDLLTAGDFNGDKTSDLLWQNANGVVADWLIVGGKRAVTFQLPTMKTWEFFTAGDFNRDGTSDVIWRNAADALIVWEMDKGKRVATFQLPTLKGWEFAAAGDFNGDSTTDLIWQNNLGVLGEWLMRDFKRAATMALPAMKGWDADRCRRFQRRRHG